MNPLTRRQNLVIAALSARPETKYAPVQVQKIFFLLDRNIADELGGPQFNFAAYDYGPFDKSVYVELSELARRGLVEIDNPNGTFNRRYGITAEGFRIGAAERSNYSDKAKKYISEVVDWACKLSFAELVGAIYNSYPEMRANSIFKG